MLKVWFPGTNDTEDYGLGGTQWINDNVVVADNGKLGKCLSFNGSNSRLSTTNFELSNNWSFACWAKDDSSVTNWRLLIMLNTTGSDADTQMSFWLHTGEKRFEVCANGKYVSTVKYVPGQWNHFAATYNGSQILIYLNGVKVYTLADTNEQLARHNLTIGARGTNANGGHEGATSYFYGLVNDLRIWDNQVISPREIKELSKGLVLHYPLAMPGNENYAKNTNQVFTSPASTSSSTYCSPIYINLPQSEITTDTQFTMSFNYKVIGNSATDAYIYDQLNGTTTSKVLYISGESTETGRYVHTYTPTSSQASYTSSPNIRVRLRYATDGAVLKIWNVKHEKGDHATPWIPATIDPEYSTLGFNDGIEYDVSGYGNNGTKTGMLTYDADTPRYNTSTVFDGTTHVINNTSTIHLSNEFTISWWGKINTWRKVWEGMFLLQNTTALNCASGTYSIANAIHASTAGLMTLTLRQGGTTYPFDHYNWTYTVGVWSHYACTYKDGVIIMYQNGAQVYTATIDNNSSGDYYYTIGKRVSNCNCQMSDFRIYNTALSAADVLELYNTPISLSNNGTLLTQGEYVES